MTHQSQPNAPRVVVVGGGLAGMATAMRLAEAGLPVTLLEALGRLGGRASSFRDGGSGELVDNCQHVLLGCCTGLMDFYGRLDVLDRIGWHRRVFFADSEGRVDALEAEDLPPPLHLMPSLLRLRLLSGGEKLSLARGMGAIARLDDEGWKRLKQKTFAQWLEEHGQSGRVVTRFWSLLAASAANETPERLSAAVALRVFREGFLGDADAYVVGLANVPLVELYGRVAEILQRAGGRVCLSTRVRSLAAGEEGTWAVTTDEGLIRAEAVVAAVPPNVLRKLCEPAVVAADATLRSASCFKFSTIMGVHLWLECEEGQPVMCQPLLGLMGGRMHWLFNKGMSKDGQHVHAVVSAAEELARLPSEEILEVALEDLMKFCGRHCRPRLRRGLVVKERKATFSASPGAVAMRPGARTSQRGLYLAGDWCDTGWPATMEGAVRSGNEAGRAVFEDLRHGQAFGDTRQN
jgi:hydroxysqualene dehydroxylase